MDLRQLLCNTPSCDRRCNAHAMLSGSEMKHANMSFASLDKACKERAERVEGNTRPISQINALPPQTSSRREQRCHSRCQTPQQSLRHYPDRRRPEKDHWHSGAGPTCYFPDPSQLLRVPWRRDRRASLVRRWAGARVHRDERLRERRGMRDWRPSCPADPGGTRVRSRQTCRWVYLGAKVDSCCSAPWGSASGRVKSRWTCAAASVSQWSRGAASRKRRFAEKAAACCLEIERSVEMCCGQPQSSSWAWDFQRRGRTMTVACRTKTLTLPGRPSNAWQHWPLDYSRQSRWSS